LTLLRLLFTLPCDIVLLFPELPAITQDRETRPPTAGMESVPELKELGIMAYYHLHFRLESRMVSGALRLFQKFSPESK
jgi:hypothetical protein